MSFEEGSPVPGAADTGSVSERSAQRGAIATPRTPRQLLGWTVPDHMHVISTSKGYHHLTCRHLVHVGGFPGRILSPHDEDLPTLVGHWFRDHAHAAPLSEVLPETPEPSRESTFSEFVGTQVEDSFEYQIEFAASGHKRLLRQDIPEEEVQEWMKDETATVLFRRVGPWMPLEES